jgi:hypothetical protein
MPVRGILKEEIMKNRLFAALIGIVLGIFLYGIAHKDANLFSIPFHDGMTAHGSWNDLDWTVYRGKDSGILSTPSPYVYGVSIHAEFNFPYCTDVFPDYPSGCMYGFREYITAHWGLYNISFDIPNVSLGWKFWSKDLK